MTYFSFQGKDRIIFVTKEDHDTPSNAELIAEDPDDPYEEHGKSPNAVPSRHGSAPFRSSVPWTHAVVFCLLPSPQVSSSRAER